MGPFLSCAAVFGPSHACSGRAKHRTNVEGYGDVPAAAPHPHLQNISTDESSAGTELSSSLFIVGVRGGGMTPVLGGMQQKCKIQILLQRIFVWPLSTHTVSGLASAINGY